MFLSKEYSLVIFFPFSAFPPYPSRIPPLRHRGHHHHRRWHLRRNATAVSPSSHGTSFACFDYPASYASGNNNLLYAPLSSDYS